MAFRRRFRKRAVRRPRRRAARGIPRSLRPKFHTVSEMWYHGALVAGTATSIAAGVLTTSLSAMPAPALGGYNTLFRQYRIRHLTWTLLPRFNSADASTAGYNLATASGPAFSLGRFAYSIADTPTLLQPGTELDVLADNGSKVVSASRKLTIRQKPVPDIYSGGSGTPTWTLPGQRTLWFNMNNQFQINQGTQVPHGSIRYCLTQPVSSSGSPTMLANYDVYVKAVIDFRDPC